MQAVQDSDGGVGGTEKMCTMHAVIVFWVLKPTSGESFRSTTGVYSRPSQLFINKIVYIRALAVLLLSALIRFLDSMCFFCPRSVSLEIKV